MYTMKLEPILTEKTMNEAKNGNYSFWVDKNINKFQIKKIISDVFGVTVVKVRTVNYKSRKTKTYQGKLKTVKSKKKAIVRLKDKEKIDLFEEKKK